MYKLITGCKDIDELSIRFDRNRDRRQRELTIHKIQKRRCHVRTLLLDLFGFAEYQQQASYSLGFKIILTRNSDNSVLNKDNATTIDKIEVNSIEWLVPHYAPSVPQKATLSEQILSKPPTELQYVEGKIFMKEVSTQNFWTFELRTREGVNVPKRIIVGFQQRERQYAQNLYNDTFYRPPVTSAQCVIVTEKQPDSTIILNYDDDCYFQGLG